ncbi:hypothetical protein CUJ83_07750 [Methanocella sp. CWC-04]|uniref:Uncharacterized protein n=1 Tax=Methanooceanicella nereidis TaxID=2052831 RepID=A0AAP2RDZ5_9EURY|nr:hypothetical protein [Methanocella sp. CWC-04]
MPSNMVQVLIPVCSVTGVGSGVGVGVGSGVGIAVNTFTRVNVDVNPFGEFISNETSCPSVLPDGLTSIIS